VVALVQSQDSQCAIYCGKYKQYIWIDLSPSTLVFTCQVPFHKPSMLIYQGLVHWAHLRLQYWGTYFHSLLQPKSNHLLYSLNFLPLWAHSIKMHYIGQKLKALTSFRQVFQIPKRETMSIPNWKCLIYEL
jgi:hypothetical protein